MIPEIIRPRPASRSSLLASLPAGLVEEHSLQPYPSLCHHSCGLISHRSPAKPSHWSPCFNSCPYTQQPEQSFHDVRVVVSVMIKPSSGFPARSEDFPNSFLRSTKAYIIWPLPGSTATSPSTSPVLLQHFGQTPDIISSIHISADISKR